MSLFYRVTVLVAAFFLVSCGQSSPKNEIIVGVETMQNITEVDRVLSNRLNERYGSFFSKIKSKINEDKTITFTLNRESDLNDEELPKYIETQSQLSVYINKAEPWLTNTDVVDAQSSFNGMNEPSLILTLTDEAGNRFKKKTLANIGELFVFEIDGKILAKVKIQGEVGKHIEMTFTESKLINYRTAALLKFGALPEKVHIIYK